MYFCCKIHIYKELMVYSISFSGGCKYGNDPGAKVSLFMHGWRQLVMFHEQKWQLSHTLKRDKLTVVHFHVICYEIQCKGGHTG